MLSRNSTSFPINNMLTTYTHQKFYSAPTHFFGIQVSHKLCINPKSLIISSKRIFQLRDAYSSPYKDCWTFAYLLASFRIDKTFWLYHIQPFLKKIVEETMFLTSYMQDFINNAVTANIIPTDS